MTSAISLLMLALSLLTAVQQNPSLPPAFREQAVKVAQTAIVEANKEIGAKPQEAEKPLASTPTVSATIPVMSIQIYALKREEGSIHYRGDKQIASVTVNGESAPVVSNEVPAGTCIFLYPPHELVPEGTLRTKVCGGFMARITVPEAETYEVVLTATDESTASFSI